MFSLPVWHELLVPTHSLLDLFLRATTMYIGIFCLFRIILKRQSGNMSTPDLLLIVLISEASQNAISSDYKSVPEGIVLILTLAFWNFAFDWMEYHFTWFARFVRPKPLPLIEDGKVLRRNLRQEFVTMEELEANLRAHGLLSPSEVAKAFMEADGKVSVIKRT